MMPDQAFAGDVGTPPGARYCPACGAGLEDRYHPPDQRNRLICSGCNHIHYRSPTPVGAAIVEQDGRLLLLRRAQEPRAGTWVFPGGFVELGETVEEAAIRECWEEVALTIRLGPLVGVYSRPGPGVVVIVYRATVAAGEPSAGHEATEVAWFARDAIPWGELAFDSTEAALRDWLALDAERALPHTPDG